MSWLHFCNFLRVNKLYFLLENNLYRDPFFNFIPKLRDEKRLPLYSHPPTHKHTTGGTKNNLQNFKTEELWYKNFYTKQVS